MFENLEVLHAAIIGIFTAAGLVLAGCIIRTAIGGAVMAVEDRRVAFQVMADEAERELAERMTLNPWNRDPDVWNITQQIEMMRADFEAAKVVAAEAGVDIEELRDAVNRPLPVHAVLGEPSELDQSSLREKNDSGGARDNVDPSYFGNTTKCPVAVKAKRKKRKAR